MTHKQLKAIRRKKKYQKLNNIHKNTARRRLKTTHINKEVIRDEKNKIVFKDGVAQYKFVDVVKYDEVVFARTPLYRFKLMNKKLRSFNNKDYYNEEK